MHINHQIHSNAKTLLHVNAIYHQILNTISYWLTNTSYQILEWMFIWWSNTDVECQGISEKTSTPTLWKRTFWWDFLPALDFSIIISSCTICNALDTYAIPQYDAWRFCVYSSVIFHGSVGENLLTDSMIYLFSGAHCC